MCVCVLSDRFWLCFSAAPMPSLNYSETFSSQTFGCFGPPYIWCKLCCKIFVFSECSKLFSPTEGRLEFHVCAANYTVHVFYSHVCFYVDLCFFLFFFICFLFCKFSICKVCECVSNKHVWLRICDKLPIHNDFANVVMNQSVCHTAFRYTP